MDNLSRSGARFVLLLFTIMVAIILVFILFEQDSTQWITGVGNDLSSTTHFEWLLVLFIIAVLAFDIVLPVPSSIVAVFASTSLGFISGALAIWLGLMLGCCFGYLIGAGSKQIVLNRWISNSDLVKAQALANKVGAEALIVLRGVPVLAETSVIAAGLVRYPTVPFLLITALSNAGLAMAYGYVGAQAGASHSFLLVVGGSIAVPAAAWLVKFGWERLSQYLRSDIAAFDRPANPGQRKNAQGINPIRAISAEFQVSHHYPVLFDDQVFSSSNSVLRELLNPTQVGQQPVFVYIDAGVATANERLCDGIKQYFRDFGSDLVLMADPQIIVGGEAAKQPQQITRIYQQLLQHRLDRHCCVLVIGGGAVLDAVGFACSTFHRGIKLLRMPSTVLAQNDAGVGVKNGINLFHTKNLIGAFSPPMAVLNDASLLQTLSIRDRRAGLAEAVKVAAIRDREFFHWMEENAEALGRFEDQVSHYAIARCAQLHLAHITGAGDPFESGNARPLDYGHWSAHKLEAIASYEVRHGEAVAIGMSLDARYAVNVGMLSEVEALRLIDLLESLGFDLWHAGLDQKDQQGEPLLFAGLEEFRQHLGGELCVTLLREMGLGHEVNSLDHPQLVEALAWLKARDGDDGGGEGISACCVSFGRDDG